MTGTTDDQLMVRAADGDETALQLLVERWERPVFAFLVRMLGSPEEAEDLCQDTFMRMIGAAGTYRPDGKFRSWLFRIAGNLARSRLRRRKLLRWLPLAGEHQETPAAGPDPLSELESGETRARVRAAVSHLPERQREALILKQYHDLSYQE
nr:sigma-70 family RNA polymerase sigma factor [bacterium]